MSHTPELILWCAFAGSWLLVAGPLHQGSIELEQEGREIAEFLTAVKNQHQPALINPWWWLLPPVAIALRARESRRYRQRVTDAMTSDQLAALKSLREKATSWLVVASGAALLAVDETSNLHESYQWPVWVFWRCWRRCCWSASPTPPTAAPGATTRPGEPRSRPDRRGGFGAEQPLQRDRKQCVLRRRQLRIV